MANDAQSRPAARLRSILLRSAIRLLLVLVIILALIVGVLLRDSRRSLQEYVSSLAQSMDESIGLIDSTLSTVRNYLSVFEPLTELYHSPENVSTEQLDSVYNLVHMTVAYSDIIQDMTVVSPGGDKRSFFNSFAVSYIDRIADEGSYDFASGELDPPRYFFFTEYDTAHDPMFLYLFPLVYTSPKYGVERVGTVAMACRLSIFEPLLDLDISSPYRCQLLDGEGRALVTRTDERFQPRASTIQARREAGDMPLTICVETDSGTLPAMTPAMASLLVTLVGFMLFAALYLSRVFRKHLMQPIDDMVEAMPGITLHEGQGELAPTGVEELDVIIRGINRMLAQLEEASEARIRMNTQLLETQLRNNEAELYALQSQINPHFLFNTLQCIRSLAILHGAEDISAISSDMSAILRYSIQRMHQVSVREEMRIVRQYLNITDIRYQKRFTYDIDVPEGVMGCSCPCMIIQPLVENAIIHGVAAVNSGGRIEIRGQIIEGTLHFEVADDGAGIDAEKLAELQARLRLQLFDMLEDPSTYGKSFGLLNIQRRIQLQYGEEYGLAIASGGGWTRLSLRLPAAPFREEAAE